MTAPNFKNKFTGNSPHLGWKPTPPDRLAKIPRFGNYVNRFAAGKLPAEFDYSDTALASFLQMLGNNQQGCCTITAVLKQAGLASANRPGPKELVSNDREALQQYPRICGPGDNGCYIPDVLDWWRDRGIAVAGVTTKILGYVLVDPKNELLIAKALYLCGSLHAGLMITQRQYEDAAPDAVWDADGSPIVGGHSIPLAGRKPQGWRMGTWAMKCFITNRALAAPRAGTELYAVIDEQWFGKEGLNNFGVDAARLKKDLETIAGGGDVPVPDPEPPTPPTPPVPDPDGWQWHIERTVNVFGHAVRVYAGFDVGQLKTNAAALDWWRVAGDVVELVRALAARDAARIIAAALKLLTDLGLKVTTLQLIAIADALQRESETWPLMEDHPPKPKNRIDGANGAG